MAFYSLTLLGMYATVPLINSELQYIALYTFTESGLLQLEKIGNTYNFFIILLICTLKSAVIVYLSKLKL